MTALATVEQGLTAAERDRLAELERVVERGKAAFLAVGSALHEIHSRRLYRETHSSFEAYVVERFEISRPRGYELIRAFEVSEAIREAGHEPPASEGALRPLRPVLAQEGPAGVVDAWERVRAAHGDDSTPTGPEVQRVLSNGTAVRPDRSQLDTAGKLLTQLEGYAERIGVEPLDAELRPTAERYAGRALALASAFEVLASGGTTTAPLPDDFLCIAHGVTRDDRGICTTCRRPDLTTYGRVGGKSGARKR